HWEHGRVHSRRSSLMPDPTTPAAPQAPTPAAAGTAPAAPVTPQPAAAEPVAPAAAPAPPHAAPPPAAPATPYAAPAAGYAPAAAPVKQTLSLLSFIFGIVGILLGFAGWGLLFSIAAVVLGFMGKKRETGAPKWMWLTGLITGWVGIGLNLLMFFILIILPFIFIASLGTISSF